MTGNSQQLASGFLFGQVTENGTPVAGAEITVEKIDTGFTRTSNSSENGAYRISRLPPGVYDVLASSENRVFLLRSAIIAVGEGTRSDLDLEESNIGRNRAREENIELVIVSASRPGDLQGTFGEVASTYGAEEIDQLPIARDINAVVNMAPGTVLGNSRFSSSRDPLSQTRTTEVGLVSIHGSSVAENVYFVDGLNVSNLSNGLGASILPFEFYDEVQMVTGGLRAQFGRTTGGMVNAVTKSGTNEWKFRLGYFNEPSSLRSTPSDVQDNRTEFHLASAFELDEREKQEGFVSVSGPLIRDRLYIYSIYEDQRSEASDYQAGWFHYGTLSVTNKNDPFLGVKVDWDINDAHNMSLTYFSDKTDSKYRDYEWDERGDVAGRFDRELDIRRGGDNYIVRYSGAITEELSVSLNFGTNQYEYRNSNPADYTCPVASDRRRHRSYEHLGCWVNFVARTSDDIRRATRFDAEYLLNDQHIISFGFDRENNNTSTRYGYSGPNNEMFRYFDVVPGRRLWNGTVVPEGITELVSHQIYHGGGKYADSSFSFYIEDEWLVNSMLNVRFGLRHERFKLGNPAGETLLKITDQWAPRIALALDLGDAGMFTAAMSRYHMPLPNSMAQLLSTTSVYTVAYHTIGGEIQEDGSVALGTPIGPLAVYRDGQPPESARLVDANLKPMYQQEYSFGYSRYLESNIRIGVDYTFRTLKDTIEDLALIQFLDSQSRWNFHYFITNPGQDVHVRTDWDGDGSVEDIHITAEETGYPNPYRKFHAIEFFVDKQMAQRFYVRGSYTWSHSYGNHEGLTRSDGGFGLGYTGVTTQWDILGLVDGAKGNLPNDRRHSAKIFGLVKLRDNLQTSIAMTLQDGRPRNAFGIHPTDLYAAYYGPASFYEKGMLSPRGALGRTDTVFNVDIGMRYEHLLDESKITFKLDVFNVFDGQAAIDFDDSSETWSGFENANFGLPTWFQKSRSVRFGVIYDF